MAWILITEALVRTKLTDAEMSALLAVSLPDGVTGVEILEQEIANTTAEVRGYVAGNPQNTLGAGATIPEELMDDALVILRYKVFTRAPNMKRLLDELRVKEYDAAKRKLSQDVPAGKFRVVPPAEEAAEQAGGGTVAVVTPRRPGRGGESRKTLGALL